jgi:branched-chain amino acid transport system substrate-binding protein
MQIIAFSTDGAPAVHPISGLWKLRRSSRTPHSLQCHIGSSTIRSSGGARLNRKDHRHNGGNNNMKNRVLHLAVSAALAFALSASSAYAQKKYDTGASDTEIKIGQTVPFSGPYSAYANIGKTQAAYIRMINDQGGINGRKLNLIQYDDAYSPPKTVEQVRKLVEGDEVLFTFQLIGTAANAAVQKYLNAKKVPQLLTSTGASRFSDPQNAPWTIAYNPNYQSEARIYAKYILANHPNAKIGILYQNDDMGRDYIAGLKSGLGAKASSMIVGEVSYEVTDPTVDSQVVKLKSLGADLLYDASTPKFAAQAIKKVADLGWNPVHILDINASPVSATLKPAGLDISKGIISTNYGKDPGDPQWKDDPGMKAYFAFMDKYFPEGDKLNTVNTYGYSVAELLVHVLRQCGDNLTRENIMRQAANIRGYVPSLALPGISITTGPNDYRVNKQMQMMKFNGERWELFGPIIEDTGPAG